MNSPRAATLGEFFGIMPDLFLVNPLANVVANYTCHDRN